MTAAPKDFAVDSRGWKGRLRLVPDEIMEKLQEQSTIAWSENARHRSELAWLSKTYSLVASRDVDAAVDLIFDQFDELLHARKFREADEALAAVDVKRLDSNLMVALLTITRAAKASLRRREELVHRIETTLRADAPKRADHLLAGVR